MNLQQRLSKLEMQIEPPVPRYRFIRIMGGAHTEEELWAYLNSCGIEQRPGDLVIDRELWQPGDPGPRPVDGERQPLRLLSVDGIHTTIEEAIELLGE